MNLKKKRRMASEILKCGLSRVWMDPERMDEISECTTKGDIRKVINKGIIVKLPKKGNSRGRWSKLQIQKSKGRRKGLGSRKGTKYARNPRKRAWISKIRAIRRILKEFKQDKKIDNKIYWLYYRKAKSGLIKSKKHLVKSLGLSQ